MVPDTTAMLAAKLSVATATRRSRPRIAERDQRVLEGEVVIEVEQTLSDLDGKRTARADYANEALAEEFMRDVGPIGRLCADERKVKAALTFAAVGSERARSLPWLSRSRPRRRDTPWRPARSSR
ncbi:MAG: hypothetical protein ACRCUE_15705 [Bosea sp. (in: a-proteobacteria)]